MAASMTGSLVYAAYRVAERLACAMPAGLVPRVAGLAAAVAVVVMPSRRRMVVRHLRRVRGEDLAGRALRRAVRTTFRSYARYWLDTLRLCVLDHVELDSRMDAQGLEVVDRALEAGRGAVLATPHLGSWDVAGAWLAGRGYPLVVVVERLEPPRLLDWFVAIRRRIGMDVIIRGPDVWEQLEDAVQRNQLAVLVCDRDLSGRGVAVTFFGERTTLPTGPAKLARRCGAPLIPVAAYELGDCRHRGVVRSPVPVESTDDEQADVEAIAQRVAWALEELIRPAPEQWHLMQPNWPSDHETREAAPSGRSLRA